MIKRFRIAAEIFVYTFGSTVVQVSGVNYNLCTEY
jgi:hypothetical protein